MQSSRRRRSPRAKFRRASFEHLEQRTLLAAWVQPESAGAIGATESDPPLADVTGNGLVDFEDLSVLLANWNDPAATPAEGNLIDPAGSSVNFNDLTALLSNWTGPNRGFPGPLVLTPLSPTSVQLNWTDVAGETGYYIYQHLEGQSLFLREVGPDVTTAIVTGLQPGDAHFFNVVALLGAQRPPAGWESVRTENAPPSSPSPLRATARSSREVLLEWSDSDGEDGYVLYEYVDGEARLRETIRRDVTSHTVTGLAANATHHFRIVAYNELGTSQTDWQRVDTPLPTADESLAAAADVTGNGFVDFEDLTLLLANWNDADATPADGNLVEPDVSSVNFDDLTVLLSNWSGPDQSFPGPLVLTPLSPSSVQLDWTNVAGETGYFVYQYIDGRSQFLRRVGPDVTTAVVAGLAAGDTHFFNIVALLGAQRPLSGWESVKADNGSTSPSSPSPLRATVISSSEVLLEWNDSGREDEYYIYEYVDGAARFRERVGRDITSHAVTGLAADTTHHFRIVAFNEAGTSESNWQRVDTPPSSVEDSHDADVTGNGLVDFEDLTVLLANWNRNVSADRGNLVDAATTPVDAEDLNALLAAWSGPNSGSSLRSAGQQATASSAASVSEQDSPPLLSHRAVDVHFDRLGRENAGSSFRLRRLNRQSRYDRESGR